MRRGENDTQQPTSGACEPASKPPPMSRVSLRGKKPRSRAAPHCWAERGTAPEPGRKSPFFSSRSPLRASPSVGRHEKKMKHVRRGVVVVRDNGPSPPPCLLFRLSLPFPLSVGRCPFHRRSHGRGRPRPSARERTVVKGGSFPFLCTRLRMRSESIKEQVPISQG